MASWTSISCRLTTTSRVSISSMANGVCTTCCRHSHRGDHPPSPTPPAFQGRDRSGSRRDEFSCLIDNLTGTRGSKLSSGSIGAARIAVDRLSTEVAHDPSVLGDGPKPRVSDRQTKTLRERTLFACSRNSRSESVLTGGQSSLVPRRRRRPSLTPWVAGGIPADVIRATHKAREFRNNLMHDRRQEVEVVSVSEARKCFLTYFARLPIEWAD